MSDQSKSDPNLPQTSSPVESSSEPKTEPLIPRQPTFLEDPEKTPLQRSPTHSKGSSRSGPLAVTRLANDRERHIIEHENDARPYLDKGSDLPSEKDLDEMEKSTVIVDINKPVIQIPFAWTCTSSRRRMFHAIATLEQTYKGHGGIGAVLLEQAINLAMGLALYSNPAPNQKLNVTIGLNPETNEDSAVFVGCNLKTVRLPPGFSTVRELEIYEDKQKAEEQKVS